MLRIHDLKCFKTGKTSAVTPVPIIGRIRFITSIYAGYTAGSFIIEDVSTKEHVLCHIDEPSFELHGKTVSIKQWNYIYNLDFRVECLEFAIEDVYLEDSTSFPSQLSLQQLSRMNTLVKRNLQFYYPNQSLHYVSASCINLVGRVRSISSFYTLPKSPIFFLVEITSPSHEEDEYLTTILFQGNDCLQYHSDLKKDSCYAFVNIQLLRNEVKLGLHDYKLPRFSFLSYVSSYQIISVARLKELSIVSTPIIPAMIAEESPISSTSTSEEYTIHYEGLVTRVIDPIYGFYELDSKAVVCLFYSGHYTPTKPYRLGTKLKLSHVHVIIIKPQEGRSSYLLNTWKSTCESNSSQSILFVACQKSGVNVLSFPPSCDFTTVSPSWFLGKVKWNQLKEAIYYRLCVKMVRVDLLVNHLEICEALCKRFIDTTLDYNQLFLVYEKLCNQLFPSILVDCSHVNNFIDHSNSCHALYIHNYHQRGMYEIIVNTYPSIDDIKTILIANLTEYSPHLVGSSTLFEINNVNTMTSAYNSTIDNYTILGMIKVSNDGVAYLYDGTCQIPLVVAQPYSSIQDINESKLIEGDLYRIHLLSLFQENLSYVLKNEKVKLDSTYVCMKKFDILTSIPSRFSMGYEESAIIQKANMFSISVRSPLRDNTYYVIFSITAYPCQLTFDIDGLTYIESRVHARVFPLHQQSRTVSSSFECVLIVSSKEKNIGYTQYMRPGHWSVVSESSSVIGNKPAFCFLKQNVHKVFPLMKSSTKQSNEIIPQAMGTGLSNNINRPVYEIGNFLNSIYTDAFKLFNGFYNKTMDITGIVISKRFIEETGRGSIIHDQSRPLYSSFAIGTGQPYRKLYIRLRQKHSLNIMDIYMDVHKIHYPLGLIPGATITLRNLLWKSKRNNENAFYGLSNGETHYEINSFDIVKEVCLDEDQAIPTFSLYSLLCLFQENGKGDQLVKVLCYIQSIVSLVFKWQCYDCASLVDKGVCMNGCKDASYMFVTSAFVRISDGTATMFANIEGERLVYRLLRLPSNQQDEVKKRVLHDGPLSYSDWKSSKEEEDVLLDDICSHTKGSGQVWMYSTQCIPDENSDDWLSSLFLSKTTITDHGNTINTVESTKPKLRVIELEYVDPVVEAWRIFNNLNLN
ncbi:CST, telomere maintenance, complex subunit CTC1-domain-containing protein [Pilobolus umbonatus]|nr:CST, telomere maintenance, complex subunit CTC1-domain-containing protein [Pilobolus umbonatus]